MKFELLKQELHLNKWQNILPNLPDRSVDLLLTDPPYGTTNLSFDKLKVDWKEFWAQARRVCKPSAPMVLFASGKFVPELLNSNLKEFRYELIWEKNLAVGFLDANRRPLRAHEQMLIFTQTFRGSTYNPQMTEGKPYTKKKGGHTCSHYGKPSGKVKDVRYSGLRYPRSVLRYSNATGGKSMHPTAKPLELLLWLVQTYSNRGDLVVDPFFGSGTTLAAAALTNRRGIGCEISEEYFETAKNRLIHIETEMKNA